MAPGRDSTGWTKFSLLRIQYLLSVIQRIVFPERVRRHCLDFLGNRQTLDSDGIVKSDMWGPHQINSTNSRILSASYVPSFSRILWAAKVEIQFNVEKPVSLLFVAWPLSAFERTQRALQSPSHNLHRPSPSSNCEGKIGILDKLSGLMWQASWWSIDEAISDEGLSSTDL